MSRQMEKVRQLAGKLFTESEISRFNAYRNNFRNKYLKLDAYSFKLPFKKPKLTNWMNMRYFSAGDCESKFIIINSKYTNLHLLS